MESYASYINVKQIVECILCGNQVDTIIEFPIYANVELEIKQGRYMKIETTSSIYNIPDTHFVSFKPVTTNIGIFTKEFVLYPTSFGKIFVDVYNSSLETRIIPRFMKIGSIAIKKYLIAT